MRTLETRKMGVLLVCVVTWTLLAGVAHAGEQDKRAAVPESAALKAAKASILDVFKEEYRQRSASAKRDLAKKLLEQSADTAGDVATRYVLLDEARDLAVEAGECGLAVEAIRGLAKHFEVEGPELEYDALSRLRRKAKTVADHKVLAKAFLDLVDEAIRVEDFETARRALSSGGTSARSAKDVNLANKARGKVKEVSEKRRAFDKVARARKTLEKTPDDGRASTTVGMYECFEKGNWAVGLKLLAQGEDTALANLAKKDLSEPSDAKSQVAVGDGWWSQGEGKEWSASVRLHSRAVKWYEAAIGDLEGLEKTRVEKRLRDTREEKLGPPDLWDTATVTGGERRGDAVTLTATASTAASAAFSSLKGPHDAVSVRIRAEDGAVTHAGLQFEGPQRMAYIDCGASRLIIVHIDKNDPTKYVKDLEVGINWNKEAVLTIVLKDGEYAILIDGVEEKRFPSERTALGGLGIYVSRGPATFDQIKVRRSE